MCAPKEALMLKPASITYEEAAAVPQAGLMALGGLHSAGEIKAGQKVLINGAGGGVGTFAVQIARLFGAEVTGVDSIGKLDLLRSLGAAHVIDYTREDFTRSGQRYDLILDVAAHHSIFDYKNALNPKGVYVAVGGSMTRIFQVMLLGPLVSMFRSKKIRSYGHKPNKDLASMIELLETRTVVPVIDKCYPLRRVPEALHYFGEGRHKGKIVITSEHNNKS